METAIENQDDSLFGQDISDALRKIDLNMPIALLNLIKFRDRADYNPESGEEPCSGKDAYTRYMGYAMKKLESVDATIHLSGVFAIEGAQDEWDLSFVVKYKRGSDFLKLATTSYSDYGYHRTAAIADSRLIVMEFDPPAGLS